MRKLVTANQFSSGKLQFKVVAKKSWFTVFNISYVMYLELIFFWWYFKYFHVHNMHTCMYNIYISLGFLKLWFYGFFRFPSFWTELVLFYMIWIYHFPQSMIILPSLTNWCAFRKYHWWVVVVKKKTALIICKKFIWYYFKEIVIHAALNRSDEYSALPQC